MLWILEFIQTFKKFYYFVLTRWIDFMSCFLVWMFARDWWIHVHVTNFAHSIFFDFSISLQTIGWRRVDILRRSRERNSRNLRQESRSPATADHHISIKPVSLFIKNGNAARCRRFSVFTVHICSREKVTCWSMWGLFIWIKDFDWSMCQRISRSQMYKLLKVFPFIVFPFIVFPF